MRTPQEIREAFAPRENLAEVAGFYLVGIGGAGMSGIARMLHHRGRPVRGCDAVLTPLTEQLVQQGIPVGEGEDPRDLPEAYALVLSDAIDLKTSPLVRAAQNRGQAMFRRSQVLGWLLQDKKVIAVTGTHGKSTTTGMIAAGLRAAGLDPTVVVGAEVPELGSAIVEGKGDWAVIEACEAYEAYRDLDAQVAVVTNLELDHVDFHENLDRLTDSMRSFLGRVPADGLVLLADEPGTIPLAESLSAPVRRYGLSDWDTQAEMSLPGAHNRLNAAGAWLACQVAGAEPQSAAEGIRNFSGVERRLQVLHDGDITVIDDYAHHPTEIRASLQALRERYPGRRVVVVYQPHLYSRTAGLIPDFAEALSRADEVVLTDIYPARERPIPGVSSLRIVELVTSSVHYVPMRFALPRQVAMIAQPGDIVVGMGAGTISDFAPAFVAELQRPSKARVAVICGGDSPEREVSLHSGQAVYDSLLRQGVRAEKVDIHALLAQGRPLTDFVSADRFDLAFLCVHGTHAEDGTLQGLLELLGVPYTGSGVLASALGISKAATKARLREAGLPVSEEFLLRRGQALSLEGLPCPAVVKPNTQGSTAGLRFVESRADLQTAIEYAFRFDAEVLVEPWLRGVETSTPVLGDRALPPVEIVPASGRYDFASKYEAGATEEICPARLPESVRQQLQDHALAAHRALGCQGLTRTDIFYCEGEFFILEVNTLPGMTPTSLAPRSAQEAGMDFDALVRAIAEEACERHGTRFKLFG